MRRPPRERFDGTEWTARRSLSLRSSTSAHRCAWTTSSPRCAARCLAELIAQLFCPATLHLERVRDVVLRFAAKHFATIKEQDAWFAAIEKEERGELPERARIAAHLLDYL